MNMNKAEKDFIIDEIFDMVEVLKEQLHSFKTEDIKIPQIELDICLDNIRRLYEKLRLLDNLNSGKLPQSQAILSQSKEPTSIHLQFEKIEETQAVENEKSLATETTNPPPLTPPLTAKPELYDKPIEPLKKQSPKPKNIPFTPDLFSEETPTIADKLAEEKPTLIDKLAVHNDDKSIVENLTNRPLADLRAAIGINEKFLFVNELFGGSLQEYNQAIQALNQAGNLDSALEIFNSYQVRFRWNPKLPGVNKLMELIQRRYL
ncbi:MAG TPA: hypothetical protein PKU86_05315 [Bacteroidales bacterium]|nr:hypothetical protein [Bacteroidales bacterium]